MMRASLICVLLTACGAAAGQSAPPERPIPFEALRDWFAPIAVIVEGTHGCHRIDALLAATPGQRARGLMFVETMPTDAGMLFTYDPPRPISMWMKNTLIPLDIVFADSARRIVNIARDTVPLSLDSIRAAGPAAYALELNAGVAGTLGLEPDLRLYFDLPGP